MNFKFLLVTCCLALPLVAGAPALAETKTILLKNGDRITGEIINAQNPLGLWIRTNFGQNIQIPWDQIETQNPKQNTASPPSSDRIVLHPPPYGNETTTVAAPANAPPPASKTTKETGKESRNEEAEKVEWSGRINVGATFQEGNSEEETVNLDGETKVKWGAEKQHRATFKAELNREKDGETVTENNRQIEGIYDYFYTKKWFINNALKFEQDDIDDIELRTTASIGLGHQVYDEDDLKLQYVFGPTYLREEFENDSETENTFAARWALDYEQEMIEDLLRFYHEHELLVPTDNTEDYLFDSQTGVRVPIRKGLVASAEIDFERDNIPEPGVKKDDTEYTLKIGYEWK